jgi:hypothetical protein
VPEWACSSTIAQEHVAYTRSIHEQRCVAILPLLLWLHRPSVPIQMGTAGCGMRIPCSVPEARAQHVRNEDLVPVLFSVGSFISPLATEMNKGLGQTSTARCCSTCVSQTAEERAMHLYLISSPCPDSCEKMSHWTRPVELIHDAHRRDIQQDGDGFGAGQEASVRSGFSGPRVCAETQSLG